MRTAARFALITLGILLSGCAATRQCSDARVTYSKGGWFHASGYVMSLPKVSLAHTGTTTFRVMGLPDARYNYSLGMNGGYHYGRYNITDPQTRVAIRITAPDGTILLQNEIKRVDLELAPGSGVHTGGSLRPAGAKPPDIFARARAFAERYRQDPVAAMHPPPPSKLSIATDYEISITVLQPAQDPNETLSVGAFAPVFH